MTLQTIDMPRVYPHTQFDYDELCARSSLQKMSLQERRVDLLKNTLMYTLSSPCTDTQRDAQTCADPCFIVQRHAQTCANLRTDVFIRDFTLAPLPLHLRRRSSRVHYRPTPSHNTTHIASLCARTHPHLIHTHRARTLFSPHSSAAAMTS